MELDEFEAAARRLFSAHMQGRREAHETARSLVLLLEAGPNRREWLKEFLWQEMIRSIRIPRVTLRSGRVLNPSAIDVAMTTLAMIDEFERPLLGIFAFVDFDQDGVVDNWISQVLPTVQQIVFAFQSKMSDSYLATLKATCNKYIDVRTRQLLGLDKPDQRFISTLQQIVYSIEEIEFTRFESQFQKPHVGQEISPLKVEEINSGLPKTVHEALWKADRLLRTEGQFDSKMAADLMRTCMDESHRHIVSSISSASQPYAGDEKDGSRRRYLCDVKFISASEEKFFSAVYSLISNEGTHKLNAPRETMLLMHQTVAGYIHLLVKRLVNWSAQQSVTSP